MKYLLLFLLWLAIGLGQYSQSLHSTAVTPERPESPVLSTPQETTAKAIDQQVPNNNKPFTSPNISKASTSLNGQHQTIRTSASAQVQKNKTTSKQQSTTQAGRERQRERVEKERQIGDSPQQKPEQSSKAKRTSEGRVRNEGSGLTVEAVNQKTKDARQQGVEGERKNKGQEEVNKTKPTGNIKGGETSKEKIQKNIEAKKIGGTKKEEKREKNEEKGKKEDEKEKENKEGQEPNKENEENKEEKQKAETQNTYSQQHFQQERKDAQSQQQKQPPQEEKVQPSIPDPKDDPLEEQIVIKPASNKNQLKQENSQEKQPEQSSLKQGEKEIQQTESSVEDPILKKEIIETQANSTLHSSQAQQAKNEKKQIEDDRQKENTIKIIPLQNQLAQAPSLRTQKDNQEEQHRSELIPDGGNVLPPPPLIPKKEEKQRSDKEKETQQALPSSSLQGDSSAVDNEEIRKIEKLIEQVKNAKEELTEESKIEIIKYLEAGKQVEKGDQQALLDVEESSTAMLKLEQRGAGQPESEEQSDKDQEFINEQQMDTTTIVIIIVLTFVISIPIFREIRKIERDESTKEEKQNLNQVKDQTEKEGEIRDETEMNFQSGFQIGEHLDYDYN